MRSSGSSSNSPSQPSWLRATAVAFVGAVFGACGLAPSRVPLGGDYSTIEAPSPTHRKPMAESPTANEDASTSSPASAPEKPALVSAPASTDPGKIADAADVVRYNPLKTGDQIHADVSFAFSAELQGSAAELHGTDNKVVLEAKLRADLKVLKSTAQSLDELEVTLTPISLHTDFDGQTADTKQDPPQTFDVTLSGQTPSIRVHGGSPLQKEDRITLLVLLTPLLEFHNHWARSPTFALKPGWSTKITLTPPAFAAAPTENVHVGALTVRYDGRDSSRTGTGTPFELGLPIHWSTDFGTLDFECDGQAVLGPNGRPVSLDLTSPITGSVGPPGTQLGLRGTAKLTVTLTYP